MTLLRETLRALPDATFADVYESDDAYLVVLDVPGVTAEAVSVHGEGAVVEIDADREGEGPEGYRPVSLEREERLEATLPLPPDARGEVVSWEIDRGVLEVTIPRDESWEFGADREEGSDASDVTVTDATDADEGGADEPDEEETE